MYEEKKIYSIKWSTLASGTHKVEARNVNSAIVKLEKDIKNLKVKVDYLDFDEIEVDPRDIKIEE